jgi:hypothetical protein
VLKKHKHKGRNISSAGNRHLATPSGYRYQATAASSVFCVIICNIVNPFWDSLHNLLVRKDNYSHLACGHSAWGQGPDHCSSLFHSDDVLFLPTQEPDVHGFGFALHGHGAPVLEVKLWIGVAWPTQVPANWNRLRIFQVND